MFRALSKSTFAVASFMAICLSLSVNAQNTALSFTGGSGQLFPNYTVGWTFALTETISVESLGWFDAGSNGFINSHNVGIFTLPNSGNGTLLTSATVTTTDSLSDGFRYKSITPLTLTRGNYVVAGTTGNDLFQAFCTNVATGSGITFGQGRFVGPNSGALTFPTQPSDRGIAYFGSNFRYSVVPAPSALATFVIGVVPGATMLLRRRRKA